MTRILSNPNDEFLYKLIELTECDRIKWGKAGYYYITNKEYSGRTEFFNMLIYYIFNFDNETHGCWIWQRNHLVTQLWQAVKAQCERTYRSNQQAAHKKTEETKQAIMELRCHPEETIKPEFDAPGFELVRKGGV